MNILILDNYDSFTYNIVQLVRRLSGKEPAVLRNDRFELNEIEAFDKIILSPGPGIPSEAGRMNEVIRTYGAQKDFLGICLGHQAIGEVYGGTLKNLSEVLHGVSSPLNILKDDLLFEGVPDGSGVGHYHSWVVQEDALPAELEVLARDERGHIMAMRHKQFRLRGLQFHPESVLTPQGPLMIKNWLQAL